MSILNKIEKVVNTVSTVNRIKSTLDSSGLLSGINLNNIDINNLGGIGSSLQSNIEKQSSSMMEEVMGSIDISSIENITSSITPQELGIEIPDYSNIMNEVNSQMSGIEGVDIDMSSFMSEIDLSGLDSISIM